MNRVVLQHHGILGQKWGIRRFQNSDGSLTPKGQARLDKKNAELIKKKNKYFKFVDDEVAQMPQKKQNAFLNYQKLVGLTRDNIDDPELYGLILDEFEDACERGIIDVNKSWESNEKALRRDSEKSAKLYASSNEKSLYHHGILGQKWGVRRFQNSDGSLTPRGQARLDKKDNKWAQTKGEKIKGKLQKTVSKDMNEFIRTQLEMSYTPTGKLSSKTILGYNNKLASLMNDQASNILAPSGRVLRFVAKRGEIGVHTAIADAGYNMEQLKRGVFQTGKVAYKQENLMKGG